MKRTNQSKACLLASLVGIFFCAGVAQLSAEPVEDFSIVDVNTTSPRYDTPVSPRDYLHQVSAYYFGSPG